MPKQKTTLSVIAQKTGLSIASVSRVIHTPHLTSRRTQHRVYQAIAELDFDTKSIVKRSVSDYKSKKILVIDNQLIVNTLINNGIESKAKENGYKLLYLRFLYFSEQEIQQIISYTINHHLDGILIINDSPYLNRLFEFQHALPPIVLVNQFSLTKPCVYFDHLSIAYQATQHLIELGHKRIAILLGEPDKIEVHHLQNGYQQALQRANIQSKSDYVAYRCVGYSASRQLIKNMMRLAIPPTAIICVDHLYLNSLDRDMIPIDNTFNHIITAESSICGVIDQCREMNIDILSELTLLQFTHYKQHKQYHPLNDITSMYKPLFSMGEEAMILLISLLNRRNHPQVAKLIEGELIMRHSTHMVSDYQYCG